MKKKKILIVGASGFVGYNIYNSIKDNTKFEVIGTYFSAYKRDLIKLDYLNDSFNEYLNSFFIVPLHLMQGDFL